MLPDIPSVVGIITSRNLVISTAIVVVSGVAARILTAILVRLRASLSNVSNPICVLVFTISIFIGSRGLKVSENIAQVKTQLRMLQLCLPPPTS